MGEKGGVFRSVLWLQEQSQRRVPVRKEFDYQQDFTETDFRQHPERYQVGRGEQGVLLVEPYKGEILPFSAEISGTDLRPV